MHLEDEVNWIARTFDEDNRLLDYKIVKADTEKSAKQRVDDWVKELQPGVESWFISPINIEFSATKGRIDHRNS